MFSGWNRRFNAILILLSIEVLCSQAQSGPVVYFQLYTPCNRIYPVDMVTFDPTIILLSPFNPRWPTVMFIHGFQSDQATIDLYRDTYLRRGDYNFIAVDWVYSAGTYNYITAKGYVPHVGGRVAYLLETLEAEHKLIMQNVTIVGHSLGAHIAGNAGKVLRSRHKIGRIFGLDPAGVGFEYLKPEARLDMTDAEYVQVIHTDGDTFGLMPPIGHADFYPNGGRHQPGCPPRNKLTKWIDCCSHGRVHDLFLESLNTKFFGVQCGSLFEIEKGDCHCNNNFKYMGGDHPNTVMKPYGVFYLETNSWAPYQKMHEFSFRDIKVTYADPFANSKS